MKLVLSSVLLVMLAFFTFTHEASAGRFGGGRSFGVQRSHSSLFSPQKSYSRPAYSQRANSNRWGSALGGLLVGGLLASLFMGHGFGTGILTWLLLGGFVLFVVGFLKRRMQPSFQMGGNSPFQQQPFHFSPSSYSSQTTSEKTTAYPAGFEAESFLRQAKINFIRLQSAYDQKNTQDLTEFTAPDVFAEIKMQLEERGDAPNTTDVLQLDAELLDVSKQAIGTIASVRFTGFIKENTAPNIALDEIWHFRQFDNNPQWVVAGIQQDVAR